MKLNDYLKQQFKSKVLNIFCTQYGVSSWGVKERGSGGCVSKITLRFTLLCMKTTSLLSVVAKPWYCS